MRNEDLPFVLLYHYRGNRLEYDTVYFTGHTDDRKYMRDVRDYLILAII